MITTIGAVLLAGADPAPWLWAGLQFGATAGVVFVHWLIVQSLYVIGALCPYCMIVWVTITITTAYWTLGRSGARVFNTYAPTLTIAWLLAPGSWLLAPGSWLLAPGSWPSLPSSRSGSGITGPPSCPAPDPAQPTARPVLRLQRPPTRGILR